MAFLTNTKKIPFWTKSVRYNSTTTQGEAGVRVPIIQRGKQ